MFSRLSLLLLCLALNVSMPADAAQSAAPRYQVARILPPYTFSPRINAGGDVIGTYRVYDDVNVSFFPFWQTPDGNYRNLDFIHPNAQISLADINDDRAVTGRLSPNDGSGPESAFLARPENGGTILIAPGAGMSSVSPTALSNTTDSGGWHVAGTAAMASGSHAFRWTADDPQAQHATMRDLGTLGGNESAATDVNASGMVTGWAQTATGERHAFLYAGGVMHDLGSPGEPGGFGSFGNAINETGTVVGAVWEGYWRAVAFHDGTLTYLGDFGGRINVADDINNRGWIVGHALLPSGYGRGFLYMDGDFIDVNTLLPADSEWLIPSAEAINDNGDILAIGCVGFSCDYVVLTAVPEPAAWALLLAGLPLLGTALVPARRRRAA